MIWSPGDVVVYRYGRLGKATFVRVGRVIRDDAEGLALWIAPGSPKVETVLADGRDLRAVPPLERVLMPRAQRHTTWHGGGIVQYVPPGRAWSVWWFFDERGGFAGWYGNLEAPQVRWHEETLRGVDSADRALDVVIRPDRTCHWKDEDEFAALTGLTGWWTARDAPAIRRDGQEIMQLAAAAAPPFDGRRTDYRPDPAWDPVRDLPPGWNRPHHAGP